jgi:integral membrane protein
VFRTPLTLFRALSVAEAITWTLLIAALIARAVTGNALVVTGAGSIHGFIFLSYGATAILVAMNQRWGVWPAVVAIASAIIPYATIPSELWLHRSHRLEGAWRLEQTSDPRDAVWYDRWMRWFLRHPWALGMLILAAVVVLYTVLVIIGPPGGSH